MKKRNHQLTVTWYGHSAFLLESPQGTRVLIDPWLENPKSPPNAVRGVAADLILVTHGHNDHVGNGLEIADLTGAMVVAIHGVALYLGRMVAAKFDAITKGVTTEASNLRV